MTLTVSAAVTYGDSDSPQVQVDVASSPAISGELTVYRTHEDGSKHRVLEDHHSVIVGTWAGVDYHAPFNQEVRYSAEAGGQSSAFSVELWLASAATWLIHPSDPTLSVLVDMVAEVADFSYADRSQRFQVLGRRLPVHRTSSPRGGETGSITVLCESAGSVTAIRALLADGGPILLNTTQDANNLGWKWIQPGDLSIKNPGGRARFAARMATFSYEETTQPDQDTVAQWTFDDMADDFDSFDDMEAIYADFDDMKLDIRT